MLRKARHETQNNVDESKKNQYLPTYNGIFILLGCLWGEHKEYIPLERRGNASYGINL